MDEKEEKNLHLRFREMFDERYVQIEEYDTFKRDRYGRVENIVFGACALVLIAVVTGLLAFIISKPVPLP